MSDAQASRSQSLNLNSNIDRTAEPAPINPCPPLLDIDNDTLVVFPKSDRDLWNAGRLTMLTPNQKQGYIYDTIYESNQPSTEFPHFKSLIVRNRLHKVSNTNYTFVVYVESDGTEVLKTSAGIVNLIGQKSYDSILVALCSVINLSLKVHAIIALLTVKNKIKNVMCQTEDPFKDIIKKDNVDAECQTVHESHLNGLQKPENDANEVLLTVKNMMKSVECQTEAPFRDLIKKDIVDAECQTKNKCHNIGFQEPKIDTDNELIQADQSANLLNKEFKKPTDLNCFVRDNQNPKKRRRMKLSPYVVNDKFNNPEPEFIYTPQMYKRTRTGDLPVLDLDEMSNISAGSCSSQKTSFTVASSTLNSCMNMYDLNICLKSSTENEQVNALQSTKIAKDCEVLTPRIEHVMSMASPNYCPTIIQTYDGTVISVPVKPEDKFHIIVPCIMKNVTNEEKRKLLWHQAYIDWKYCLEKDEEGYLPIHQAVLNNDEEFLKRMCLVLKSKNETVDILANNVTALQLSISNNSSVECTKVLINQGADLLLADEFQCTPIHHAAEGNVCHLNAMLDMIETAPKEFLESNEELQFPGWNFEPKEKLSKNILIQISQMIDSGGYTPLMLASKLGLFENVSRLVQSAPQTVNFCMPTSGETALHLAVSQACMAKAAESATASGVVTSLYNKSPEAYHKNYLKTVEILFTNGADPSINNFSGVNVHSILQEFSNPALSVVIANLMMSKIAEDPTPHKLSSILVKETNGMIKIVKLSDDRRGNNNDLSKKKIEIPLKRAMELQDNRSVQCRRKKTKVVVKEQNKKFIMRNDNTPQDVNKNTPKVQENVKLQPQVLEDPKVITRELLRKSLKIIKPLHGTSKIVDHPANIVLHKGVMKSNQDQKIQNDDYPIRIIDVANVTTESPTKSDHINNTNKKVEDSRMFETSRQKCLKDLQPLTKHTVAQRNINLIGMDEAKTKTINTADVLRVNLETSTNPKSDKQATFRLIRKTVGNDLKSPPKLKVLKMNCFNKKMIVKAIVDKRKPTGDKVEIDAIPSKANLNSSDNQALKVEPIKIVKLHKISETEKNTISNDKDLISDASEKVVTNHKNNIFKPDIDVANNASNDFVETKFNKITSTSGTDTAHNATKTNIDDKNIMEMDVTKSENSKTRTVSKRESSKAMIDSNRDDSDILDLNHLGNPHVTEPSTLPIEHISDASNQPANTQDDQNDLMDIDEELTAQSNNINGSFNEIKLTTVAEKYFPDFTIDRDKEPIPEDNEPFESKSNICSIIEGETIIVDLVNTEDYVDYAEIKTDDDDTKNLQNNEMNTVNSDDLEAKATVEITTDSVCSTDYDSFERFQRSFNNHVFRNFANINSPTNIAPRCSNAKDAVMETTTRRRNKSRQTNIELEKQVFKVNWDQNIDMPNALLKMTRKRVAIPLKRVDEVKGVVKNKTAPKARRKSFQKPRPLSKQNKRRRKRAAVKKSNVLEDPQVSKTTAPITSTKSENNAIETVIKEIVGVNDSKVVSAVTSTKAGASAANQSKTKVKRRPKADDPEMNENAIETVIKEIVGVNDSKVVSAVTSTKAGASAANQSKTKAKRRPKADDPEMNENAIETVIKEIVGVNDSKVVSAVTSTKAGASAANQSKTKAKRRPKADDPEMKELNDEMLGFLEAVDFDNDLSEEWKF